MGTGRKRQYFFRSSSTFDASAYSFISSERCSTIVVPRSASPSVSSISNSGVPVQLQCTSLAPSRHERVKISTRSETMNDE